MTVIRKTKKKTMKNNTFAEISQVLLSAKTLLLYPHIHMDGDAVGSCAALCKALRLAGKEAYVLVEEDLPLNLRFLDQGYFTKDPKIFEKNAKTVDLSVCVDCGDESRFPGRAETFRQAKTTICIDHHQTTEAFCDYNHVDPQAAAAGELVYRLLQAMGTQPDPEIGEAIFAAITTDTGNFQYSNTTRQSFQIAAELCGWGIDTNKVSVEIYENVRPQRKRIEAKVLGTMRLIGDGRGAVCYMTQEMLAETGALAEETEDVVGQLRSIAGVEYAAFLKEQESGEIRVSLRAKRLGNVADIAARLGGGGHIKAAGGTIRLPLQEALQLVEQEILRSIRELPREEKDGTEQTV